MEQKVTILDTTLRDGEQSLQASLNVKDKLKIALALENLGIDIIEVGFPISSPGEFKATKTIAQNIKTSQICGLARCLNKDIDAVAEALKTAKNFRIHIFIATSTLHIKYKLKKNFKQIIEMIQNAIKYARKYTDNIQFSCEDAGRTNIEKLYIVVENAIKAGAYTINIPDTVGYTTPTQFSNIITSLYNNVPNIDKAIISVHCHNDLGMAVGNSITAIEAGARQIEGTINGIGERAGNTALEEVIMAIKTRNDILNVYTNIKHKKIYPTCQIVSKICNIPIPYNKAITGSNAFAHSSGIHQDGIIKNRKNYEIINPKSIGLKKTKFNLTSRSGRAAIKKQMQEIGYKENDYDINELYKRFLTLADKKGQIFEYDLEKLAFLNSKKEKIHDFSLKDFIVTSNYKKETKTTITLLRNKKIYEHTLNGNCPIETINKILINITKLPIKLNNYQLIIKNNNKKTIKQTNMIIEYKKRTFHGTGSSKNIIESFIKAILQTINNILYTQNLSQKIKKQDTGI